MIRKLLLASLLLIPLWTQTVQASDLLGSRVGAHYVAGVIASAGADSTTAMAANDAGWDARFTADSVLDVTAITVNWATVSVPGTVSIFIETDDGTGKPSGTLYDANATLTLQVPGAGTKTYTFAVAPTTGLTIGSLYHVLIITTGVGTTQTLNSYVPGVAVSSSSPTAVLTSATATTRNTFAVVSLSIPAIVLTRTGGVIESFQVMCQPFISITSNTIYGTRAVAAQVVTQGIVKVVGYAIDALFIGGTLADNLRIRLFDGSNAVVSGSTVTVDKDTVVNNRNLRVPIGTAISIVAGTYRIVVDEAAAGGDASNNYNIKSANASNASAITNATLDTTTDVTATPPTWTNTTTAVMPAALLIDTITPTTGGGIIGG